MNIAEGIRFRQSHAKVLLTESPADLHEQLLNGRDATRAMEAGSLFDYLVFDLDQKYEVVDARYRTGPRANEPVTDWQSKDAQESREEIRSRGFLPVLQVEVDAMSHKVARVRERIRELLGNGRMIVQRKVEWTSIEAGFCLPCEGTPDLVFLYPETRTYSTADLKNVASVIPRKLKRQVHEMCWDVQGAAYAEAACQLTQDEFFTYDGDPDDVRPWTYAGHTIIACQSGGREAIRCYPLDDAFMWLGTQRWAKAQTIFKDCLDSNSWPDYPEDALSPPRYAIAEYEDEGDDLTELGLEPRTHGNKSKGL